MALHDIRFTVHQRYNLLSRISQRIDYLPVNVHVESRIAESMWADAVKANAETWRILNCIWE
jgi:hypothetical protein